MDLYTKLSKLPEEMQKKVDDFIESLKSERNLKSDPPKSKKSGLAKGLIEMTTDFDDPLEDLNDYQ